MTTFFVTATGTDIGKTFVTAGLLRALREKGEPVAAIKPLVSGFSLATAAASDPGVLLEVMGEAVSADALARISPWRYAAPLSPDMAAAREGQTVDYEGLIEFCRARMAAAKGHLFIEGVGGVMVPLDARRTVRDWMAALGVPLILVAGSYLGTISHTLTALDVIARARLSVAGIVVNETPASGVSLDETIATLQRFAGTIPTGALSRGAGDAEFTRLWQMLSVKRLP